MANVIKRFARHRDDMRLANFQRVRGLDAEWKLLRCPTEYCLPNLTPPWANRNLGANRSDVVSGGILKRDVNVAVCFHFYSNDAARESRTIYFQPQCALNFESKVHPGRTNCRCRQA